MNPEYAVQIIWSQEDQAYVAAPFELPGCAADGETPEEALANLKVVIAEWIEVAKEEGREIPKPMSREDFDSMRDNFQRESERKMREQIEVQVNTLVNQAVGKIIDELFRSRQQPDYLYSTFTRGIVPAGFHRD